MPSKVSQNWALSPENDLNKTLDDAASLWNDSFVRRIGRAPGTERRKYLLAEWTASSGFGHPFAVGGSDEIALHFRQRSRGSLMSTAAES
jgi:hypothetical protein